MILNQSVTQQFITPEYLAYLSGNELTDLLLHRSKLFMVAMTSQLQDMEYLRCLERDIKTIHEEIKNRR
ncbi:MAG TPA: hypothetical protein VMZ03_07600 [Chitinophagaceae bacterium]|nr:hypothetical protein [Chitinophagaceae bacterium]